MAMNSLKSCLTPEDNSESKGLEYYFKAPSISHLKCPRGDSKGPTERKQGKQYIIYKWSHAMISEKLKAIKSQNSLKKQYISKQSIKRMNLKLPKVPLRPLDEK